MSDDLRRQLLEKKRELGRLEEELARLERQRLADLYPGRCFQYCLDHELASFEQLASCEPEEIRAMAEEHHFLAVARQRTWPCSASDCAGWQPPDARCACGTTGYCWLYETRLPLDEHELHHEPAPA